MRLTREEIEAVFTTHPRPWSSGVIHDASGDAIFERDPPRLWQFYVDTGGSRVRTASGGLVHTAVDGRGQPLRLEDRTPVLIELELSPADHDDEGRPLL